MRPRDTLASLGERFKVPWQVIAKENDITIPRQLRRGRLLLIPKKKGVAPPPPARKAPPAPGKAPVRPVPPEKLHRGKPSSRFWWPTSGAVVRHSGDILRGLPDPGIAIAAAAGTRVYAADKGKVIVCLDSFGPGAGAWGKVVAIEHSGGWVSWYAHLDTISVKEGDLVKKGSPIGTVGATGGIPRPQLAFRLFHGERPVDPERELP
ncbi:MAG: M23 family metallopeptidase [Planctomycetes bacterium]|nr:M23 family metallopeptidase [Planctomycetota bacterium]